MPTSTSFATLESADLVIDRIYPGGSKNHIGDDPTAKLFPRVRGQAGVGNQGGFRFVRGNAGPLLAVLFSTTTEPDWPDDLDALTGRLLYYGDNRQPGRDLHDTAGNRSLATTFHNARGTPAQRAAVAPHLLFQSTGEGRDVRFRGLLAPGGPALSSDQELVAIWRTSGGSAVPELPGGIHGPGRAHGYPRMD